MEHFRDSRSKNLLKVQFSLSVLLCACIWQNFQIVPCQVTPWKRFNKLWLLRFVLFPQTVIIQFTETPLQNAVLADSCQVISFLSPSCKPPQVTQTF
jgi:hypothetical protein